MKSIIYRFGAAVLIGVNACQASELPSNRNSPFMKVKDANQCTLQAYPLDSLHFVGVIRQDSKIRALIKQPAGKINTVKINDVIGNKRARILRITDDSIEIEEINNLNDSIQNKIIVLHLRY